MTNLWKELPPGTIVDADIQRLAQASQLITDGFEPKGVRQACYELRASHIFHDVASPAQNNRVEVADDTGYLLKPSCYVVCVVMEKLGLPANVLGRILTKGRLFSAGILPVNTYADPGFEGRLGITLYNASKRYILIRPGEPIAKIEFVILPRPVSHPYNGQHGYETEIWPIASQLFADTSKPSVSIEIGDAYTELKLSHGEAVAEMFRKLRLYSSAVWLQLLVVMAFFTILLEVHGSVGLVTSLWVGIAANLITMLGVNLFMGRKR